jgi:hypothetical protein
VTAFYKYHSYVSEEINTLSVVLKGHLLIEKEMEALLDTILYDSSVLQLDRKFFPQKVDLLIAIGTFSRDVAKPYKRFNLLRRKYAHNVDYELKVSDIQELEDSLAKQHKTLFNDPKKDININARLNV